jgi:predicted nucleic acid-binding protein
MMILDTNVVSELMKQEPAQAVSAFIGRQSMPSLFIPSIVVAEIRYGLRRLPTGQRRDRLTIAFDRFLAEGFTSRVLPFDAVCADSYAQARVARERAGHPVSMPDALIGGIVLAYGATLVTRNISDFEGYGLKIIDPWQEKVT